MTLDDMLNQVILDVPEAPIMTVREQIKRMARELCQEADAWVIEGIVVVAAKSGYAQVLTPENGEVLRISALKDTDRDLKANFDFEQKRPNQITMLRDTKSDTLTGRLACRPAVGADLPEALLNDHADTICNGARWRLLLMPQPWRDPEMATYYQTQYRSGTTDAKRLASFGHARGGIRVKARQFI